MNGPPRISRLVGPVLAPGRVLRAPGAYARHLLDRRRYRRMPGAETLRWRDEYPQLWDRLPSSPYDAHYFFQDTWAANRIAERGPERHVDVGSRVDLAGFLTALTDVVFVDLRPLEASIERLTCVKGSILALPFENDEIDSLSCLHVAEHIGLGRYGDDLEPRGTVRAAAELARVLAPGGQLLVALPVGRSRVEFNAHRIHDPATVVELFGGLSLVEFAGVDDAGRFERHRELAELSASRYACGMFHFHKPTGS